VTGPSARSVARQVRRRLEAYRLDLADWRDRRIAHPPHPQLLEQSLRASAVDLDGFLWRLGRQGPGAGWGEGGPAEIVAALESADPGWRERTLDAADRIVAGHVRLLGEDDLDLLARRPTGSPGAWPWHCDVTSDYAFDPGRYYRAVAVPYGRADIKVPWELSRCQHLPTLAMAHLASGEPGYAQAFVDQVLDWVASNPARRGVNWACTMEVAIRAVNWIWGYGMLAESGVLSEAFQVTFAASLLEHARHVAANVEVYAGGLTTNHTAADYVGLLHLSLFLADLAEAAGWQAQALAGLERCIAQQVNPDGCDFEGSTSYHRLALELFLGGYLRARSAGGCSASYAARVEAMFEALYETARPDGLTPLVGDADDGRLLILHDYFGWVPQDHRYLLAVGGSLFERPEWLAEGLSAPGGREELAWQLGAGALAAATGAALERGRRRSRAFAETGRYVLRNGEAYALVNADPVGTAGMGNHHHNHWLSYELALAGRPVAVDPGSYTYTKDPVERDRFRSTRAHNTVVVDGAEQCELAGPFGVRPGPPPRLIALELDGPVAQVVAEHSGYGRLRGAVTHRRSLRLASDGVAVTDLLAGKGRHEAESFVHLAPGCEHTFPAAAEPALSPELAAALQADGVPPSWWQPEDAVVLRIGAVAVHLVPYGGVGVSLEQSWVSERYGQRRPAPTVVMRWAFEGSSVAGYCLSLVHE